MVSPERQRELSAAASRYREAGLWRSVLDSNLFAVRLPDGETGYCCAMGLREDQNALRVYVGEAGISTYMDLLRDVCSPSMNCPFGMLSALGQDCLQAAFEGDSPCFRRCVPMRRGVPLERDRDAARLALCLRAGAFLAGVLARGGRDVPVLTRVRRSGDRIPLLTPCPEGPEEFVLGTAAVPAFRPPVLPELEEVDEVTLARLKRCLPEGVWDCCVAYLPSFRLEEEPDLIPSTPLAVNATLGRIIPVHAVGDFDRAPQRMHWQFLDSVAKVGVRPAGIRIHPRDRRAHVLFLPLARALDIPVQETDRLPELGDAWDQLGRTDGSDESVEFLRRFCDMVREKSVRDLTCLPRDLHMYALSLLEIEHPVITEEVRTKIRRVSRYWS